MKWAVRIAGILVLLAVAGVVAIAIVLPRVVESQAVRARIEQAALDATGRTLQFDSLAVGLLPPAVRVLGPRLAGETASAPPLLEAREVSLRIALLPLLVRTLLVDSLVVDGATLRLERTDAGLVLPEPAPSAGRETGAPAEAGAQAGAEADGGAAFDLAVRSVRLRESRVLLVDRSVRPAATWDLGDLHAEAEGHSLAAPIDVALETSLASGGRVEVSGTATRAGEVDLEVGLEAVELAPLAPYLEGEVTAAGRLGGSVTLVGPADAPTRLVADLRGTDVRFRRGDVALRGAVAVEADVASPTGAADGRFDVDATEAELAFGGGFVKPPGTAARVTGRLVGASGGGYAVEDVRLRIRNLEATGRVGSLSPLRVQASAPPFELAGWETLLPALAGSPLRGRLGFSELRFDASPMALRGTLRLEEVASGAASDAVLSGVLLAEGSAIRSQEAVLGLGGEQVAVDATVRDLFGTPRHRITAKASGASSSRVVGALFSKPDTIEGPLDLDLGLSGPLGGDLLQALSGRIEFGVTPGRLVDVSILKLAVAQLGSAGQLASLLGKALTGDALARFYDDRFELFRGVLEVEGGRARTDDLTLRYPNYGVVLRGSLGLQDLDLKMTGELEIDETVDAALARTLGAKDHVAASRVLPLASVGGTLDGPKISLAPRAVSALLVAYGSGSYREQLREGVEKEMGEGTGELVDRGLETLEGLLKSRRKPAPEPQPGTAPAPAPETAPAP